MPDVSGAARQVRRLCWVLSLLLSVASANPVTTSEVRAVSVEHVDGAYRVFVDTIVAARLEDLEALLLDFEAAGRLNPSIKQSEILGEVEGGGTRVRMRVRVCEFFICRNLTRIEIVTHEAPGVLRGVIDPEDSDFKSGTTEWWLASHTGGTRLIYSGAFEPDFWVPPLIGPPLMARRLREELSVLVNNLEVRAQARAAARSLGQGDAAR